MWCLAFSTFPCTQLIVRCRLLRCLLWPLSNSDEISFVSTLQIRQLAQYSNVCRTPRSCQLHIPWLWSYFGWISTKTQRNQTVLNDTKHMITINSHLYAMLLIFPLSQCKRWTIEIIIRHFQQQIATLTSSFSCPLNHFCNEKSISEEIGAIVSTFRSIGFEFSQHTNLGAVEIVLRVVRLPHDMILRALLALRSTLLTMNSIEMQMLINNCFSRQFSATQIHRWINWTITLHWMNIYEFFGHKTQALSSFAIPFFSYFERSYLLKHNYMYRCVGILLPQCWFIMSNVIE